MPWPVSMLVTAPPFFREMSRRLYYDNRSVERRSGDLDVDAPLRTLQEPAVASGAHRVDLRQDRQGRRFLRLSADVESAGPHDPVEVVLGNTCLQQPLAAPFLVAPRAQRTHVERGTSERGGESRHVELVV